MRLDPEWFPNPEDGADDTDGADDDSWTDDEMEDAFPLGDGVADVVATVWCPWCGEPNEIAVDPGGGGAQEYVEDCQVCCRPWRVQVTWDAEGRAQASVWTLTDE